MTSSFTLPTELVDEARRKREASWLSTIGSDLDTKVRQGMGALNDLAGGAAQQLSPFAQALAEGGLRVPSVEELTPDWIKTEQHKTQQPMAAPAMTIPTEASAAPPAMRTGGGTPAAMPQGQASGDVGRIANAGTRASRFAPLIAQVSAEEGVPADVLAAIIDTEDSGETSVSVDGARGLTQVVPGQGFDLPGEDASDPLTSIRQGARALREKYRMAGGDWRRAGGLYFGVGVDSLGNRSDVYQQKFDENRARYMDGQQPTVPARPAPTTPPIAEQTPAAQQQAFAAGSYTPNQIEAATSEGLDYETALAVCGPAAAIAFARKTGRNPTMQEAVGLAREVGWTVGSGMAGPGSQQRLLERLGVAARLQDGSPDWNAVAADVQRGNPVIVSTPAHYFVAERYDPESGAFDFGNSAAVLKASGGRRWFRPEELPAVFGEKYTPRASLFMDSPQSPSPSVVAGRSQTAGVPPTPAGAPASPAGTGPPPPSAGSGDVGAGDMPRLALSGDPPQPFPGSIGAPSEPNPPVLPGATLLPGPSATNTVPDGQEIIDRQVEQQMYRGSLLPTDREASTGPAYDPRDADQGAREWQPTTAAAASTVPLTAMDTATSVSGTSGPQPFDADQGPREATPGSVGASRAVGPLYGPEPVAPASAIQAVENARAGMADQEELAPREGVLSAATAPARGVYGRAIDEVNESEDAIIRRREEVITNDLAAATMVPQETIRRGVRLATAILQATPEALTAELDAALAQYGYGKDDVGVDLPVVGRVGIADAVLNLAPNKHVQAAMQAGGPVGLAPGMNATFGQGAAGVIERGAGRAVQAGREAIAPAINAARGAGTRVSEALAEGRRVARAADAAEGGTVLPGTLGVSMGTDAQGMVRPRVIPPDVADTLDFPVRIPDDPAVIRAIEAAGGSVDPERGVNLPLIRQQDEAGAGRTATRGAVFYTAGKPGTPSEYAGAGGPKGVGGPVRIEDPTTFRSPLVLPDAPGSNRGFDDGVRQLGLIDPRLVEAERAAFEADKRWWQARKNGTPAEAETASMEQLRTKRVLEDLQASLGPLPRAMDIDQGLDYARRAGPPGSPARAQAIKDLVARYGGDPDLVDEAVALRGESSESTWAIKENILAHNARRQGYDGVLTVASETPSLEQLMASPVYSKAREEALAASKRLNALMAERHGVDGPNMLPDAWNAEVARVAQTDEVIRDAAMQRRAALDRLEEARQQLSNNRITELADFREGANPTPGKQSEAWAQAQAEVEKWGGRLDEISEEADRMERYGTDDEVRGVMREYNRLRKLYDDAVKARESIRTEAPGFTLRSDIPRRPEPSSDTLNAVLGADLGASGGSGRLGDVNRALGAGIRSVASGSVGAAVNQEMNPDDPNAAARGFAVGAILPQATGRAIRAGLKATGREAPGVKGALISLGDVPPSKVGQQGLPGMESPAPRPIGEVAADLQIPESLNTPQVRRALTAAQRRQEQMERRGLTTPSAWDWIKQAGYAGIYGPATLTNAALGGAQELLLGQPKEAIRALVAGRPRNYVAQAGAQIRAMPEGLAGLGRILWGGGSEGAAAVSGGSQGTANLSERVVNPAGHLAARGLERPGEILTEAPDAVFRPMFLAQGMQREAGKVAAELGLRGREAQAYADDLMRAADELRLNPDTPVASEEVRRVVQAGADYADRVGYKGDAGGLGRWLGQLSRRDDAVGVLASFLTPFPGMVGRMATAAAQSTPGVGLLPAVRRGQPTAFDVAYDQAFGTAVAAGIAYWAFNGGVTGSGPSDKEKRDMMIDQGWQPNSYMVGNSYIPNRTAGRFQPMLDTAGELHDAIAYAKKDYDTQDLVEDLVKRGSKIATDQIGLSGLADLHDMFTQGFASRFPGWAARSALRHVPYSGVLRGAANALDDKQRKPEKWGDQTGLADAVGQNARLAVPGLRQGVPATQDSLGREVPNPQQGLGALIPRVTTRRDDPTIQAFQQAGVDIGKPKDSLTIDGITVPLSPAERRRWQTYRGEILERFAPGMREKAWWSNPQAREVAMTDILTQAGEAADQKIQKDIGAEAIRRRVREGVQQKRRAS